MRTTPGYPTRQECASPDGYIETTRLEPEEDEITVIGAITGGQSAVFVKGVNPEELPAHVDKWPLLVSFNGIKFDVPCLQARFPEARLDQPHIDLRFVLRSLGYRGGLKSIEKQLGVRRDPRVQEIGGLGAVRLWEMYCQGDQGALEQLIQCNLADVRNLGELMGADTPSCPRRRGLLARQPPHAPL